MSKELVTIKGVEIDLSELDSIQYFGNVIDENFFPKVKGDEKTKANNHLWEKLEAYRLANRKSEKKAKIIGVETLHTSVLPPKPDVVDKKPL